MSGIRRGYTEKARVGQRDVKEHPECIIAPFLPSPSYPSLLSRSFSYTWTLGTHRLVCQFTLRAGNPRELACESNYLPTALRANARVV
ncbi:hypothetical protein PUN28_005794 [Cardiocondyla obscurior]|uniref:Uncharacterized protein n=1 Tax=Cardiocondyla obscurior TaxID=286306 RepID=A0AAW2GAK1_9HYME